MGVVCAVGWDRWNRSGGSDRMGAVICKWWER